MIDLKRWEDGEVSDGEMLADILTANETSLDIIGYAANVVRHMNEKEAKQAWYRLEGKVDGEWRKVPKSKVIKMTKDEAAWVNQSCQSTYRWKSSVGDR